MQVYRVKRKMFTFISKIFKKNQMVSIGKNQKSKNAEKVMKFFTRGTNEIYIHQAQNGSTLPSVKKEGMVNSHFTSTLVFPFTFTTKPHVAVITIK